MIEAEALLTLGQAKKLVGPHYKAHIREAWMTGNYTEHGLKSLESELQRVRNNFGPTWLIRARPASVPKPSQLTWKVHTPNLLEEIVRGSGMDIYRIPVNMLAGLLAQVAERASQLNDPKLNALMCSLTLYAIANPKEPEYDAKRVEQIINDAGGAKALQVANQQR